MSKLKITAAILLFPFCNLVYAQASWDLRALARSTNPSTSLVFSDKSTYMVMPTSTAKALVSMTDRFSLLSGVYPKIYIRQSNALNASAGYTSQGEPFIFIDKPMFDLFVKDGGAAAAVIGHEMAHLYLRHSYSSVEARANAAIAGAIIGTALEILFIGRLGVIGLGTNIGNAFSSGISNSYSRDQERDADRQGMLWALQLGYDPDGATRLFAELAKAPGGNISFFSSHPSSAERSDTAKERADLFKKYKSVDVLVSPELLAFNQAIDEDRERQLPKSDSGKAGAIAFSKKDYAGAKISFEECAKSGEISCINNLGVLYQFGLSVPVDRKKAVEYYKQASDKGSGLALHNYNVLYASGNDGPLDTSKLIKLSKEASERGSAQSMGTLALSSFMSQSFGFPREWQDKVDSDFPNQATLVNYAKAAAMRGVKDGQTALGSYYLHGFGVPKNIDLAENYLTLASNANDIRADAALVVLYENEKIDNEKAQKIKDKYKSNPNATAALSVLMANFYCKADAPTSNNAKCFDLAKKGRSFSLGPVVYGYILSEGRGTPKDLIEGSAWLLYAKNKTGHNFASWAYERNIAKLNQADVNRILAREKEIAASPNTQP
jgi:TPR repeat protein/Zn-dependent protease with chaperone function